MLRTYILNINELNELCLIGYSHFYNHTLFSFRSHNVTMVLVVGTTERVWRKTTTDLGLIGNVFVLGNITAMPVSTNR